MLDLDLLKTFVSVVDESSFTRAAERVHRTQSTVSQQILRLEGAVGHALLLRDRTGQVTPTERGELLAGYARRLLAMALEAEDALASPASLAPVRLGVPEDFDARRLTGLLAGYVAQAPGLRLDTVSGMSRDLQQGLQAGELDLALVKREIGDGPALARWAETLVWVAGAAAETGAAASDEANGANGAASECRLALFPQGCIYRLRAIRSLETAGRRWRIAFGSHSLAGIQAAVSSGLAISVLPRNAVLADHRILGEADGYPALPDSELALVAAGTPLNAAQRGLAAYLAGVITTD